MMIRYDVFALVVYLICNIGTNAEILDIIFGSEQNVSQTYKTMNDSTKASTDIIMTQYSFELTTYEEEPEVDQGKIWLPNNMFLSLILHIRFHLGKIYSERVLDRNLPHNHNFITCEKYYSVNI